MVAAARGWVGSPDCFLTIWGKNGTGKSMLLQALTVDAINHGKAALYVRAHDLLSFLKGGIGDEDYDVEGRTATLGRVPILCIDELTLINWTNWVAEHMESLLDLRYVRENGTVLAMDEDPATFLPPRLLSRMKEGIIVVNRDDDFRPSLAAAKRRRTKCHYDLIKCLTEKLSIGCTTGVCVNPKYAAAPPEACVVFAGKPSRLKRYLIAQPIPRSPFRHICKRRST